MEKPKYVSDHYAETLDNLAHTLVTARRFGGTALEDTVVFESEMGDTTVRRTLPIPANIVRGNE